MSGGHFQYNQRKITDIAEEVDSLIATNDCTECNEHGEPVGYFFPPAIIERFMEASTFLRIAAIMAQRIDWLVSGDDGPESFVRRWDEELAPYREYLPLPQNPPVSSK